MDVNETLELLERAVAEKGPDHVYQQHTEVGDGDGAMCRYANPDGTPDCIVGYVLSYVGLLGSGAHLWEGLAGSLLVVQKNFTVEAIQILLEAQITQDNGKPWGEALEAAKNEAGLVEA